MTQETSTTPPSPPPEAPVVLVERILARDRQAEEHLVEIYGRPVRLLLRRHTRSPSEAEDLFQDTFRHALEKLRRGELRDPAKLPGFLSGLARNLAIEVYRKAARRKTEPDSEVLGAVEARHPGPLDTTLAQENASLVRRVLAELPNPRDREILFRIYLSEEDRMAVANRFEMSLPQLNRVLHRARGRYKKLYLDRARAVGLAVTAWVVAIHLGWAPRDLGQGDR